MEPIAVGLAAACLGTVARINLLHSPRCAKLFLGISVLPSFIFSLYEMAREVQASQMAAVGRVADLNANFAAGSHGKLPSLVAVSMLAPTHPAGHVTSLPDRRALGNEVLEGKCMPGKT